MSFFSKHKQLIVSLILASFMMFVFWGLMSMTHEANGQMRGNCPPFSAFGASLCSQDGFAAIFHHISSYQSVFDVTAQFGAIALMLSLFLVLFLVVSGELPATPPVFFKYDTFVFSSILSRRKAARWLSLFENSPSY